METVSLSWPRGLMPLSNANLTRSDVSPNEAANNCLLMANWPHTSRHCCWSRFTSLPNATSEEKKRGCLYFYSLTIFYHPLEIYFQPSSLNNNNNNNNKINSKVFFYHEKIFLTRIILVLRLKKSGSKFFVSVTNK